MSWLQTVVTALSALAGGFVGGCVVAFRLGRWRQRIEDRIAAAEERLEKGDRHVGQVPILLTRVDLLIKTLDEFKQAFRDFTADVVTRRECDRRHARNGSNGSNGK